MKIDFEGKVCIVTGAAGGIGEAICEKLADLKLKLVLTGRNEEKLNKLAEKLNAKGIETLNCVGDLCEIEFLGSILKQTKDKFGRIDILINNAGLAHNCGVEEMTPELFDSIIKTNVRAPYFLSRDALPYLRESDCATIINICSVVAHKGYPSQSVYAASKHALLGFSKSLANEVYKENIRVHAISPGGVFTPMIAHVRPDLTPEGMILPEDIANYVAFLLENRGSAAVIDEIQVHRSNKEPFA